MEPLPFVQKAQQCGFDVLEVRAQKIARMRPAERGRLKGAAADAGLGLTYSIGMTADMDMLSEDAAIRKNAIDFLGEVCRAMLAGSP